MDQKNMEHLHNGILRSRTKGAPILYDSMDGTGEHFAKWNKPGSERQIPYDPYDFLNNIFFSLAYFIIRIQYTVYVTYKNMC